MSDAVGLEDLNLYGSTLWVDAAELVAARGAPANTVANLELISRSLAPNFEDPVTLAVNAAKPLVDTHGAGSFELLLVCTESGVDYGKPLSSYVHRHLGLAEHCMNLELKHACFSGTAGLMLAAAWVRTRPGKKALVITTDMSRKLFTDPAEPVEGAGAVAMVVSTAPRLLAFDEPRGFAAREIYDVMRPTPTLETGTPELSLGAYLDLLESSWETYRGTSGARSLKDFRHLIFHTPLVPLVRQAHSLLLETLEEEQTKEAKRADFERRVRPSLGYCQQLGNIYSGSLYAALAGLIDSQVPLEEGTPLGLFSYGSGSCAAFFSATFGADARRTLARHRIADHLKERVRADFATYERIVRDTERGLTEATWDPDPALLPGHREARYTGRTRLVLESVRGYYRNYRWL